MKKVLQLLAFSALLSMSGISYASTSICEDQFSHVIIRDPNYVRESRLMKILSQDESDIVISNLLSIGKFNTEINSFKVVSDGIDQSEVLIANYNLYMFSLHTCSGADRESARCTLSCNLVDASFFD